MKPHNNGHIATTLGQLAEAEAALGRLAARSCRSRRRRIAKLARAVADETRHFQETRNALVRRVQEVKPGGGADDIAVTPTRWRRGRCL